MCLPGPIPPDVLALDRRHRQGTWSEYYFRTVDWNRSLFERHGLSVTHGSSFPEAYRWWLDYAGYGKVSPEEQDLNRTGGGRWLSLGLEVGEKVGRAAGGRRMTDATDELRRLDEQLAGRHGAYLSYATDEGPALVEHHKQPPAELVDRLLGLYARPDGCFLDVGCGAGFTLCRLAPRVREACGIDILEGPLEAARLRAEAAGLTNVTVMRGNVVERADADQLPDGRFALVLSRRGPNFNEHLMRKLAPGAYAVQELVGGADCGDLRELLGRRAVSLYHEIGHDGTIRGYLRLGLFPITSTEFFFEEFFRDVDHLEAYLRQAPANVSDWRLGPKPYVRERDRPALELYASYHRTPNGIRLLRHRWVFALRRVEPPRYPVDALDGPTDVGTPSSTPRETHFS